MRTSLIAIPSAALVTVGALSAVAPASAAPAPAAAPAQVGVQVAAAPAASRALPVRQRYVRKYRLKGWELRQIRKSKRWAETPKARSVRQCESGDRYRINTGNGYYGAWQFAAGTWLGVGGGRYAQRAHQAPKFAQDHMAWRLWTRQGWGPWSCA